MSKRESSRQTGINNFIGVASIDESTRQVVELGGKIINPKQTVPGFEQMALCLDTENTIFGLFQKDFPAR